MNGNGEFGLDQRVDQFNIFLAGMSGYMYILKNNIRSFHQQLVDDIGDCLFIARNGVGGHDDGIGRPDAHLAVHAVRHSGKSRHAFPLRAGGNQNGLILRIIL